MTPINKVLTNIEQDLSEEEKATARANIGAAADTDIAHPVVYISNVSTDVPTLTQVQAMIDAGKYVVLMYSSGVANEQPVVMQRLTDERGSSSPHILFAAVYPVGGAIEVKLTGSGFSAPTYTYYDKDKIEAITIPNGATTWAGANVALMLLKTLGKIPYVKYGETGSDDWGYYWLAYVTATTYTFARATSTAIKTITVTLANGSISYTNTSLLDITLLAPLYQADRTYVRNSLVVSDDILWRARYNIAAPGAFDSTKWVPDKISNLLGRVQYGVSIVDQSLPSKWYVPNNAICQIETNVNSSGNPSPLELVVELDLDEVANFCVEMRSTYGGILTVTIVRRIPGQSPTSTITAFYAKDAGNSLPVDKPVQITCVGTCWTMAEFVDPTAVSLSSSPQSPSNVVVENPEVT